jgi:transcription elongation factor GreA-like protein/transcription elongation GreA/GreB family factor
MAVSVDVVSEMTKLLNEERISKHSLGDYQRRDFVRVEEIVDQAIESGDEGKLQEFCESYINENPNSVYAFYAIGLIYLKKGSIDTYYMPELIKRFNDEKKMSTVIFLVEKVLAYREEKYALKILEEYYKNENRKDELVEIRERIANVDHRDGYTPKYLAEYYEAEGNIQKAIYYYKLALERFINLKNSNSASAVFEKLVSHYTYVDYRYLLNVSLRLLELVPHDKIAKLLHKVATHYKKKEMYNEALQILKFILSRLAPNDAGIRTDLKEVYEALYPGHTLLNKHWNELMEFFKRRLSSYIRISPDEVLAKLNEFEKLLKFDVGVYVYHRTFGVGKVVSVEEEWIVIDFVNKKGHRMSHNIAFSSLEVLKEDDIRVWKSYRRDELEKLIYDYSPKVIKMALIALGGEGTVKEIKEVLSEIVPQDVVNNLWNAVRSKLGEENIIVSPTNKNKYIYVSEAGLEDNIKVELNSLTSFEDKIRFVYNFLQQGGVLTIEQSKPIVEFLKETFEKSDNRIHVVVSGITLLVFYHKSSGEDITEFRKKLIDNISKLSLDEVVKILEIMDLQELRKDFLVLLRSVIDNWDKFYVELILKIDQVRLNNYLFYELASFDRIEAIKELAKEVTKGLDQPIGSRFKSYMKYIWFAKLVFQKEYEDIFKSVGISKLEVIMSVIKILSSIQLSFEERGEKGITKRIYLSAKDIFDKYEDIESLILNADKDVAYSLFSSIEELELLDSKSIASLRGKLFYKYPDLKSLEDSRGKRSPYLATKATIEKIKNEYNRLLNEELPKVSKLASTGQPEYIEKEGELKAIIEQMANELSELKVINRESVSTEYVDVGTKVVLRSKATGETIEYHILGDKEADPSKGIISYKSPLGLTLLDNPVGTTVKLNLKGTYEDFVIESISVSEYV